MSFYPFYIVAKSCFHAHQNELHGYSPSNLMRLYTSSPASQYPLSYSTCVRQYFPAQTKLFSKVDALYAVTLREQLKKSEFLKLRSSMMSVSPDFL